MVFLRPIVVLLANVANKSKFVLDNYFLAELLMTFKKLIPAAIMAIAATTANAGGFDGPFVQLGVGGSNTWTSVSGTDGSFDGKQSQGSVNGLVAAGWSQSIGAEGFNLAANLFYVIGNQNAMNANNSTSGSDQWGTWQDSSNLSNKLTNTFGISVEPGWNFTESTLGYVKLAWLNSRQKTSWNGSGTYVNHDGTGLENWSDSASWNKTVNGFGYGIGAKQLVTKNIFVGVDLMGVTYGSVNVVDNVSMKPSQFMGFASVGYKF